MVKNVLPDWQGTERVNILLLGIDKRDDEPIDGTRSDTIIWPASIPVTKSAALVSLPRDLWVTIPGCTAARAAVGGQQRINFAHAVGGPDLAARTITADFGVPIQYYARSTSAASTSWSTRSAASHRRRSAGQGRRVPDRRLRLPAHLLRARARS